MESYNLGIIKMTTGKVGKGLILKRELSLDECKYILSEIFRFESYTLEDFYDEEEYQEQMDEYKDTVNAWLKGDCEDQYSRSFLRELFRELSRDNEYGFNH